MNIISNIQQSIFDSKDLKELKKLADIGNSAREQYKSGELFYEKIVRSKKAAQTLAVEYVRTAKLF